MPQQRCGRPRIAEVSCGGRRAAELDPALPSVAEHVSRRVDQADLVTGDRPATTDETERIRVVRSGPGRLAGTQETVAVDSVHDRPPADRRESEADAGLGQPVDRGLGLAAQPIGGESLAEPGHGVRAHRFCAVEEDPQRPEVEPIEFRVGDLPQAQFVGEVRGRGQRALVGVDGPKPLSRPREEVQRRHHGQRYPEVQARQPRADQTHVVVKGKPADEHVRSGDLGCLAHRPDIGQQVRVGQSHALGVAGATGGVLNQSDVARPTDRAFRSS